MIDYHKNTSIEDIEGEIWKDINGFLGYQVSSYGRIKVLKNKLNKIYIKILNLANTGYLTVSIYDKELKCKNRYLVHIIVAKAFIPNPENKPQVNHKKGIKTDNRVSELEWATQSENMKHAFDNNLTKETFKKGFENKFAKLNNELLNEIIDLRKNGFSLNEISCKVGMNHQYLSRVFNGKIYGINVPVNKVVIKLDVNGNYLEEYKSITNASEINNISISSISRCCNGKKDSIKGFKWIMKKNYKQ